MLGLFIIQLYNVPSIKLKVYTLLIHQNHSPKFKI